MTEDEKWANKDKRISFLSILSTLVGSSGYTGGDILDYETKAYKIVDTLFTVYPGVSSNEDVDLKEKLSSAKWAAPATSPEQYQGNGEVKKSRVPFMGKDGKTMYPVHCGSCQAPSWSPNDGVNTKSCKNCR